MDPLSIIGIAGTVIKIGEDLYTYISGLRTRLQATGEWTDAQEQAFLDLQAQRNAQPYQQPTDPPAPPTVLPPAA